MKRKAVDMHLHSFYSDGNCPIYELAERAAMTGLIKGAVLTDHDTEAGTKEFLQSCKDHDILSISGVEISTSHSQFYDLINREIFKAELYILGYGFEDGLALKNGLLRHNQTVRIRNIEEMAEKYRRSGTMKVFLVDIMNKFDLPCLPTSKYWLAKYRAEILMQDDDKLDFQTAFRDAKSEILEGGKFYVKKESFISPDNAINLINSCSGVSVWAHPMIYFEKLQKTFGAQESEKRFDKTICEFKVMGLHGVEVYGERMTRSTIKFLLDYCRKYELNPNFGGSDYHGDKSDEFLPEVYFGKGGISMRKFKEILKILEG